MPPIADTWLSPFPAGHCGDSDHQEQILHEADAGGAANLMGVSPRDSLR